MAEHDSPTPHRAVTTTLSDFWGAIVTVEQSDGSAKHARITIETTMGVAVVMIDSPGMLRQVLTMALAQLDAKYPPA
jgi:hypothetical protein